MLSKLSRWYIVRRDAGRLSTTIAPDQEQKRCRIELLSSLGAKLQVESCAVENHKCGVGVAPIALPSTPGVHSPGAIVCVVM